MLKISYTDMGVYLEHLTQTPEDWMTARVLLALKTGHSLILERCTASLLVPMGLAELYRLEALIVQNKADQVSLFPCDTGYLEITMRGNWVASQPKDVEGVFITALSAPIETTLVTLWQEIRRMEGIQHFV